MEIATRELDANLILILFSLKKKFNIFVGDSSTYRFLLSKKFLQPGIVLTKSVTHGEHKSKLHSAFKAQGFILTTIDHEHGVLDDLDYKKYFIKSRIAEKELTKFDALFCWGNYDYEKLQKAFPHFKNKFFLTGSNRVDAWKNIEKLEFKNNKYKKKIGIFTNFALSNNKYGEKKIFKLKERAGFYTRCPELLLKDKLFLKYQKKNIKKFLELINYLPIVFPDYIFYLKPHPVENLSFWKENIIYKENLKIVNPENSSSLIKFCDLVIQTRCTTSIESLINSTKNINFIPVKNDHGFGKFVDKISDNAKNKFEVINLINKLIKYKKNNLKKSNILNSRVLFKNNIPSSERMTSVLSKLSKKIKQQHSYQSLTYMRFSLLIHETYIQLKSIIYNFISNYKNINEYKFPIMKKFTLKEKMIRYSKIYKNKKKIKITKLGKRFWLFESL